MPCLVLVVALFLVSPLYAQYSGNIYTPEIHLGSATEPSTYTVPPIQYVYSATSGPAISNATPADTELLAQRHWDFVASPMSGVEFWSQGGMGDSSISLGEYARQLRARKPHPAAMPSPPDSR